MKRIVGITFVIFMISSFMTQIETIFFESAFAAITRMDAYLIMFSALPSIIVATMLSANFSDYKEPDEKSGKTSVLTFVPRIAAIGIIYTAVYMLFGYFVLWQFEEARIFYSGVPEDAGFIGVLMNNDLIIYPF